MVIVITVLGLLMAFLIPKITEAQAKARDIKRQSDITMIAAALVSYKHDHGTFPPLPAWTINGICVSSLWEEYLSGYLTSIPQDPSNKWLRERTPPGNKRWWCETWYAYITNPDQTNFILAYIVDPSIKNPNWNYLSGGNGDHVMKRSVFTNNSFKESLKQITTWQYFVYIYK